jgi:hypothetical protein
MKSKKPKRIELLLRGFDDKGRPYLAVVEINTHAQAMREFLEAHVVTSVYGKRSIENYLMKAKSEDRLLDIKKEDSAQGIAQVQYKGDINAKSSNRTDDLTSSDIIISNSTEKINPSDEKNSLRNVTERQYLVQILKTMNTDVEHNTYFQEYLQKAAELDRKQAKVDALAEEWRELAYQKGKRSEETKERLQEIRTEITSLRSEINAMDNRLLTLGEMRPFRNLVYAAQKEQKVRDKEKMAEYRKEVKRRADRAKVVRALKDLGSYLTHESKDHHIPAELRKQFAEVLDSFNLDYSKNGSKEAATMAESVTIRSLPRWWNITPKRELLTML